MPSFLSPAVAGVLVEKFDIKPIGTVEEDVSAMVAGKQAIPYRTFRGGGKGLREVCGEAERMVRSIAGLISDFFLQREILLEHSTK